MLKEYKNNQCELIEDYIGNGEKILIVDDVDIQRETVAHMLNHLQYQVDAVASGEEAIRYIQSKSVDLILLDMIMDPGIDGLETYRGILKVSPQQKAIITSGFSETDRVREALRLGAGQYIKKPFTLQKIGEAVRTALR